MMNHGCHSLKKQINQNRPPFDAAFSVSTNICTITPPLSRPTDPTILSLSISTWRLSIRPTFHPPISPGPMPIPFLFHKPAQPLHHESQCSSILRKFCSHHHSTHSPHPRLDSYFDS